MSSGEDATDDLQNRLEHRAGGLCDAFGDAATHRRVGNAGDSVSSRSRAEEQNIGHVQESIYDEEVRAVGTRGETAAPATR